MAHTCALISVHDCKIHFHVDVLYTTHLIAGHTPTPVQPTLPSIVLHWVATGAYERQSRDFATYKLLVAIISLFISSAVMVL